jgi:hypothetical protein
VHITLCCVSHIHGVGMKFLKLFYWATYREPCDLIVVDMSVHVSTRNSYDFNALTKTSNCF